MTWLQVLIRATETHCRPPVAARSALVPYENVEVFVFVTDSSLEARSLADGRTPLRVGDATVSLPQEDVTALKRSKVKAILSTIQDSDRILLLNESRLVAMGTHQSLLASNELYRSLVANQQILLQMPL